MAGPVPTNGDSSAHELRGNKRAGELIDAGLVDDDLVEVVVGRRVKPFVKSMSMRAVRAICI
jgi:hypothetical protein